MADKHAAWSGKAQMLRDVRGGDAQTAALPKPEPAANALTRWLEKPTSPFSKDLLAEYQRSK